MKNPKISVVVPVYQVEAYLNRCIKSILQQDYSNVELIAVVDETSGDGCEDIIDRFRRKDSRVKKYLRGHFGLGDARNCGIEHASGDYIVFVDSDDHFCCKSYLSEIAASIEAKEPDYIITRYRKLNENTGKSAGISLDWNQKLISIDHTEKKMVYILDSGSFCASAWAKAVKKDFIASNGLKFSKGYSEDLDWTGKILNLTDKIEILYTDGYSYLIRNNSLSKTRNLRQLLDMDERIRTWEKCIKGYSEYDNAQRGYLSFLYFVFLGLIPYLPKEDQKQAYKKSSDMKAIVKYSRSKKTKLSRLLCCFTGYKAGSWFLNKYIDMGAH